MENKFDPKAKVKQGDLGSAPDGKQPNQEITNIDFSIPQDLFVSINIYDLQGRNVATLVDQNYSAGHHTVNWNAEGYTSGIYFMKLDVADFTQTQKLMLVK